MSKKKVLFIIGFIIFLVVLWFVVYNVWLGVEPSGSNYITAEQLAEMDKDVYTEAKIFISDVEYSLSDITPELIGDNIVVSLEVDNKKYKGYVVVDDTISEPCVELVDDVYARVLLPYNK